MARIVCVGEAMLELSRDGSGWALGSAGDTLNTATHLARAGHDVAYLTAVGTDSFSDTMAEQWRRERVDCSLVLRHPSRHAGLYAISTDASGERSFTYWRENSAARQMFDLPDAERAIDAASDADLLVFSLISLAILPDQGRERLLDLAARVRARGGKVAFDGNYRPRLWRTSDEAQAMRDRAIDLADIGLPTLEDEQALSGEKSATAVSDHWRALGCAETIVKLGARGCLLPDRTMVAPEKHLEPVDTSGAGDAFNAGYLDTRLSGASTVEAARAGHRLAGWTIMRPGGIPARD